MTPDSLTLVVVSAAIPAFMGLLLLTFMLQRKVYAGFGHWVAANFILSGGYIVSALRDYDVHPFISIIIGNVLVIYTEVLVYEGFRLFFGQRKFSSINYILLLTYTLVHAYFTFIISNFNIRVLWYSVFMAILITRIGFALWSPSIPELKPTAQAASILVFLSASLHVIRIAYVLHSDGITSLIDNVSVWINILAIFTIVGWAFYYFFLTSARLELELHQAREEMTSLAITDPLTGLHNRRYLMEHGVSEFKRAQRQRQILSVIFLDLDNLKPTNDRFGHDAGDMAILHLARILQSETRPYDLTARFGGDEFVILLPNTAQEQALQIAERIRTKAIQTPLNFKTQSLPIQLSLGVASSTEADTDVKQVMQRADTALYQAKNEGRNRVAVH